MLRITGARLAVPLSLGSIFLIFGLVGLARPALAAGECRRTSSGVVCAVAGSSGGSRTTTVTRAAAANSAPRPVVRTTVLPPLRYLATSGGRCWYWSRYPPGYDSWNPRNDQNIIVTRFQLPQCSGRTSTAPAPVVVTVDVPGRAWSIFRSFLLDPPVLRVTPAIGITNLPSRLHLQPPREFAHAESLPDGRRLQVVAHVETVTIDWGDGTTPQMHSLGDAVGDPGGARHTYLLKTCTADYRAHHLDGPKCHPTRDHYPVGVTFTWTARYSVGGGWTHLGAIDRSSGLEYDVDEVLGVLTATRDP